MTFFVCDDIRTKWPYSRESGDRKSRNGRRKFGGTQSLGLRCLVHRIQDMGGWLS